MDDLCRKHMDLPAQEFAMGCSFLHQIALGIPLADLASIVHDRPSLINFRDYDRRTPLHIAASEGHFEICQYLLEQGVKLKVDTQKETEGDHNGMKMATLSWKGTDKDGDCSVSLVFLQVTDDTAITLIYWATDDMVKKHEKDINGVLESMKSLTVKKGKKKAAEKDAE